MATIQDVHKFWNTNPLFQGESDYPAGTREWFEEHERIYNTDCLPDKSVYDFLTQGVGTSAKILDVGCGPGFWVRYFLRNGYPNVWACDLTERAVMLTRASLEMFSLHTNGDIVVGNAEMLPFPDDSFDYINCQGVIHHTPHTSRCVDEFFRVLRPGGIVCFSVYYQNFLLRRPRLFALFQSWLSFLGLKGRGRERMVADAASPEELVRLYDGVANPIGKAYSLPAVEKMVHASGLKLLNHRRSFFPARAFPVPFPRCLHVFCDRTFGLLIMIRAIKP